MKHVFGEILERQITIRGNDQSWQYMGRGCVDGKQTHMASAAEEIMNRKSVAITRETTILIDDDRHNIKTALDNNVRAVWHDPDDTHGALKSMMSLSKGL